MQEYQNNEILKTTGLILFLNWYLCCGAYQLPEVWCYPNVTVRCTRYLIIIGKWHLIIIGWSTPLVYFSLQDNPVFHPLFFVLQSFGWCRCSTSPIFTTRPILIYEMWCYMCHFQDSNFCHPSPLPPDNWAIWWKSYFHSPFPFISLSGLKEFPSAAYL